MWHLLNPKLDDTIPKERVIAFIQDLIYISVDLMLRYLKLSKQDKSLLDRGTTTQSQDNKAKTTSEAKEEEINRACAVKYLEEAKRNSKNIINNFKDLLPRKEVARADIEPLVRKETFFRSFQIRQLLTKNFSAVEDDVDTLSEIQVQAYKVKKNKSPKK